ncbi:response regulator [Ktedonosporobacter rubrisoli]|uniref:Response regulator n=1 Tax=Ktedonosporobacter rubrisoli TaxID=2509675 RepID=A0A4P6JKX5_KTERU|nr:response regulator [Ktedonosporobacter rubrisoli]QBD75857.1 response regulator [Ktedonosporobacter rubrisoli]
MKSERKRVLIVDDDPDILLAMAAMLEDAGYSVTTTEQGTDLEYIQEREELPDIILLDMLISGSDGCQIARWLKHQPATRHIPLLMLSAHPTAEQQAREAGVDDFLAKPFELDELLSRVAAHLG